MSLQSTSFRLEFRVWDKVLKHFVSGPFESLFFKLNDYVVTQFTGVRDVSGVKIFQGDILSGIQYEDWFDKHGHNFWGFVAYNDRLASYRVYHIIHWGNDSIIQTSNGLELTPEWSIMGNVFEHPELLIPPK
jgi:hypothetical protein